MMPWSIVLRELKEAPTPMTLEWAENSRRHTAQPVRLLALGAAAMLLSTPCAQAQYVPYFPTPQPLVDRMLEMAELKESDFVVDLGCGDGRILVTAAPPVETTVRLALLMVMFST